MENGVLKTPQDPLNLDASIENNTPGFTRSEGLFYYRADGFNLELKSFYTSSGIRLSSGGVTKVDYATGPTLSSQSAFAAKFFPGDFIYGNTAIMCGIFTYNSTYDGFVFRDDLLWMPTGGSTDYMPSLALSYNDEILCSTNNGSGNPIQFGRWNGSSYTLYTPNLITYPNSPVNEINIAASKTRRHIAVAKGTFAGGVSDPYVTNLSVYSYNASDGQLSLLNNFTYQGVSPAETGVKSEIVLKGNTLALVTTKNIRIHYWNGSTYSFLHSIPGGDWSTNGAFTSVSISDDGLTMHVSYLDASVNPTLNIFNIYTRTSQSSAFTLSQEIPAYIAPSMFYHTKPKFSLLTQYRNFSTYRFEGGYPNGALMSSAPGSRNARYVGEITLDDKFYISARISNLSPYRISPSPYNTSARAWQMGLLNTENPKIVIPREPSTPSSTISSYLIDIV